MFINRTSLHFAILILVTLIVSQRAQADPQRVFEEKVGPVPEFVVPLKAGETVSFETRNLSPDMDPVLHLWDPTNRIELAMDDNSGGGKAAKLRQHVTVAGNYLLIVRPRNLLSSGTTDLFKNGVLFKSGVRVEGWYVFLLSLQTKEQISVLPPPLGAPTHLVYLISDDGLHMEARRRGSPRSRWEVPLGFFGARTMLIGVRPADAGKPMRVYRNDVRLPGADPDGDGLGTELERQLKTCSVATDSFDGLTCNSTNVADLRDTDGDGISDGWEVLGRDFSPSVYVALPTWGSNPRHKDMFVEVDFRRLNQTQNNQHIAQHMPPNVARQFAAAYGDQNTTDSMLRLFHSKLAGNPDQQPGLSVHIDSGVQPETPADAAIYGDWGGYEAIDAVADAHGHFVGQSPAALWKTHMHPSRRGIFRYGPGHQSGGGQCAEVFVACGYNFNSATNAIHEMLHSLGLAHQGFPAIPPVPDANCKPNYPSTVNYAFMTDMLLSDGSGRPPLNNTRLKESNAVPVSDTGYITDLQNKFKYRVNPSTGDVDWNRDGVVAPADQTVRAYANYQPGNGCEFTRMNQVEIVKEVTSLAITRMGTHTLVFSVDPAGRVTLRDSTSNWNCPAAAKNCEGSSFNSVVTNIAFPVPTRGIDAAVLKVNGLLEVSVIAIGNDGKIRERVIPLAINGDLNLSPVTHVFNSVALAAGEPSLAETRDGLGIYLIYKGVDNVLRWRLRRGSSLWGGEHTASDPNGVALVAAEEASPGIASGYLRPPNNTPEIYLAYSDATHSLRLFALNTADRWEHTSLMSESPQQNTLGRPTMAWVPNTNRADAPGQFYLLFRDAASAYKMMRTFFDFATVPPQNRIRIGLLSYFDNVWLDGNTIDVIASSATGHPQLWAVLAHIRHPDEEPVPLVLFRPRADGIVDLKQSNHDDWKPISWGLCQGIVNPGNTVSNPIRCPNRPL